MTDTHGQTPARPFALWLCPTAASAAALERQRQDFAAAGMRTDFPLHITLASGPNLADVAFSQWQPERHPVVWPLEMDTRDLVCGPSFFQSAYVTFAKHQDLEDLHAAFCAWLKQPLAWHPHLSLAYGSLTAAQKQAVEASLVPPRLRISFDRVVCWAPKPGFTWHAIDQWQRVSDWRYPASGEGAT